MLLIRSYFVHVETTWKLSEKLKSEIIGEIFRIYLFSYFMCFVDGGMI